VKEVETNQISTIFLQEKAVEAIKQAEEKRRKPKARGTGRYATASALQTIQIYNSISKRFN
jgi:hypothetical protein